jgi:hypothetical protein
MAVIFALLVLGLVLWIVFNLMRSSDPGDIVTYRVDYPGVYIELARERKTDGSTTRKPAKRALSVKAAEGEGISDD